MFDKYKKNLKFESPYVYSYNTKVAEVKDEHLVALGYWSATTSKHINFVGRELGLKVIDTEAYNKLFK